MQVALVSWRGDFPQRWEEVDTDRPLQMVPSGRPARTSARFNSDLPNLSTKSQIPNKF